MTSASSNVFYCPQSVRASDRYVQIVHPISPFVYPHYGYNFLGATHSGLPKPSLGLGGDIVLAGTTLNFLPAPERRVLVPSQMIAIGDSGAFLYTGVGAQTNASPSDFFYILFPYVVPAFNRPGVGDWHDGNANMLFCDGHIQCAKQSVWIENMDQARRLWNNDNQSHPETW
jgi:prepilin-type processing-associated H-X9-DG protein